MKKKNIVLCLILLSLFSFSSCKSEKGNRINDVKDRGSEESYDNVSIPDVLIDHETSYTIKHMLEQKDGSYETYYVETSKDIIDGKTNAQSKNFDGFVVKPFQQKFVNLDNSTEVIIKYTLKKYSLYLDCDENIGQVFGSGFYDIYNNIAHLSAKPNIGYDFVGWYIGDDCISHDSNYDVDIDKNKNIHAEFEINDDFKCFEFESTENTCVIKSYDNSKKELIIPEGVTTIESYVFNNTDLTFLTLPNSLIDIKDFGIYNNDSLLSIKFKSNVKLTNDSVSGNDNLYEIYNLGGASLNKLTYNTDVRFVHNVDDESNIKIVNDKFAFYNEYDSWYLYCYLDDELSVNLPESFEYNGQTVNKYYISDYAFGNKSVISLTIPQAVKGIDSYAFSACRNLYEIYNFSSLNITRGSTNYGNVARYAKTIHTNNSISILKSNSSYDYVLYSDGTNTYAEIVNYKKENKKNVVIEPISGYDTRITPRLFENNLEIETLEIKDGVISIGENAFNECYNLYQVEVPETLTTYGTDAFYRCYRLKEVINHTNLSMVTNNAKYGYISYYALNVTNNKNNSYIKKDGDFVYYEFSQNYNYLIAYLGNDKELIIPEKYNIILAYALMGNSLEKLIISDKCSVIYNSALYLQKNLKYIELPVTQGVSSFSLYFENEGYNEVYPSNFDLVINSIKAEQELPSYYYSYLKLKSFSISNNLGSLGENVFYDVKIDDFYYDGSIEDWISMSKETNKLSINNFYFINDNGDKSFNNKNYSKIDTYTITKSKIDDYDYAYLGIRKIIIPKNIDSIGNYAFYRCLSLEEVVFEKDSYCYMIYDNAFQYCESLSNIKLPNELNIIRYYAFSHCSSLKEIDLSNVGSIFGYAFEYTALTDLYIPNNVYSIGYNAFSNINSLISAIDDSNIDSKMNLFVDCNNLQYVKLSNKVKSLGENTIYRCNSLNSLVIPSSVNLVKSYAINNCDNLKLISFSKCDEVQFKEYAISYCKSLENIILPKSLKDSSCNFIYESNIEGNYENGLCYLGSETNPYLLFYRADNDLESIRLNDSCKYIYYYAFEYLYLDDLYLPNDIKNLKGALCGINALYSLQFSGDIEHLYDLFTFSSNGSNSVIPDSLYMIGINEGVEELQYDTFENVELITSLEIPSTLKEISSKAFYGCNKLYLITNHSNLNLVIGSTDYGYVACYASFIYTE